MESSLSEAKLKKLILDLQKSTDPTVQSIGFLLTPPHGIDLSDKDHLLSYADYAFGQIGRVVDAIKKQIAV